MDFVELNRKLEEFDNRFGLCVRAGKLARKALTESLHDETRRNPAIETLEKMVSVSGGEPELSDRQ